MTSRLLLGPGSLTLAQVISFSLVAAVFILLVALNVTVCYLYRRARTEDARQAAKLQRKKMSDVWVYHVHRPSARHKGRGEGGGGGGEDESPSAQILKKLKASHENLRASWAETAQAQEGEETLGLEEQQALEELDVMNDLFMHDGSRHSSRRSSISDRCNDNRGLQYGLADSFQRQYSDMSDQGPTTTSSLHLSDHDSVSLSSVRMSDFENDPHEVMGLRRGKKNKKAGRARRKGESGGDFDPSLPVAEFHNEAFDLMESTTAVERVKDIEL